MGNTTEAAMSGSRNITRRGALAMLGCSAAAAPFVTPVSFAAAPGDNRLVVILLRGAMDGLDVLRPEGDRHFAGHRAGLDSGAALGLTDFHRLHGGLKGLLPMWRAGELGFVQAVSTPYRDKRSHFDGQDLLETGGVGLADARDGWLNRLLTLMPGAAAETAFAVGRQGMLLLSGAAPVSVWSPDSELDLTPQAEALLRAVYAGDPLFARAAERAIALSAEGEAAMGPGRAARAEALAAFAAGKLTGQARIAAFSINGWDTHANQATALPRALAELEMALMTLKAQLGAVWARTAVLCLTEFGRTVRANGAGGTDHGTGGMALFAGGAVRGGQVLGDWPGLGEGDLYDGRDLMPTRDVRAYAGWALAGLFGLSRTDVERVIFPGLEMGGDPGLLA